MNAIDKIKQQDELNNQARAIAELKRFVKNFLDNFETCPNCDNGDDEGETCFTCQGTGKRIASLGVLYVELPEDARELLK